MNKYVPLTDQLRRTIETCGKTRYVIAKETGVGADTLCRFVSGERGLSMAALDTLARYLGLELRPVRKPKAGHKSETKKGR